MQAPFWLKIEIITPFYIVYHKKIKKSIKNFKKVLDNVKKV